MGNCYKKYDKLDNEIYQRNEKFLDELRSYGKIRLYDRYLDKCYWKLKFEGGKVIVSDFHPYARERIKFRKIHINKKHRGN